MVLSVGGALGKCTAHLKSDVTSTTITTVGHEVYYCVVKGFV